MIQDIYPHRLDNRYRPREKPTEESRILSFTKEGVVVRVLEGAEIRFPEEQLLRGDQSALMLRDAREIQLPKRAELPALPEEAFRYLFSVDGQGYFLYDRELNLAGRGYRCIPVKELRREGFGPKSEIFAVVTGLQLFNWYRRNRYCGCCGTETVPDELERAIRCPACGNLIYPRIVPAVIVGVIHEDKLLLTKYARGFRPYALVAGFTEIGETLEQTVEREVMEEAGLRVKNIRYYKSQPWGIVDDILMGYFCEVDGSPEIRMDRLELSVAEWKTREEIELQPDDFSLTNEMMLRFKRGEI